MPIKPALTAIALTLCLAVAAGAHAESGAAPELKSRIDELLGKLEVTSHGLLKWEGAERLDIREDGDAAIADIAKARISIGAPDAKPGTARVPVELDHIEVRGAPAAEGAYSLSVVLPSRSTLRTSDGEDIEFTLTDATLKAVLDAKSFHARESKFAFAGARIAAGKSHDWVAFGPLSFSYTLVGAADGSWTAPADFELKRIEFSFEKAAVVGGIDRVSYHAQSAGPDLAAMNRLRDRVDALRNDDSVPPAVRLDALIDLLPSIPALMSSARGELAIEGVSARAPAGEPYFAIAKAGISGALTGLSGEAAALRITIKHDGLVLAPAVLDPRKAPQHAVVDIGLEDVGTGPLRSIIEAAVKLRDAATDADKRRAMPQIIAAAAQLTPVLRIYDLAVDTADVGVEATAEARGSPLSPKGYSAQGDVTVRGFDALPGLVGDPQYLGYLPVLKEIGTPASAKDGTARIGFHLTSTLAKWIAINGNDVAAWLADDHGLAPSRLLRPQHPPMSGDDVGAVQRALAVAKIPVAQNGVYDGATAAAVARFQKRNNLNADGVVDSSTRQKLGLNAETPRQAQPKPGPGGR